MAASEANALREALARIAGFESILRDTLWMARRYAHGRQSYAVGMYNDAVRRAVVLDFRPDVTDGSYFALDGSHQGAGAAELSGLSHDEFRSASIGLNEVGVTPHPGKLTGAALTAQQEKRDVTF